MPAWAAAVLPGRWYQIPGTSISAIDADQSPGGLGPFARIAAWTSLVVDSRNSTVYQCAGGGHTDYAGNECERLWLGSANPVWETVRGPTPAAQVRVNSDYYADGRPNSRHHYYGLAMNERGNRIMLLPGARYADGRWTSGMDSFNLSVGDYAPAGTHPIHTAALTGGQPHQPSVCRDPRNDNIYVFGRNMVARWDPSVNAPAGTWSSPMPSFPYVYGCPSAFDSRRNRILIIGGENFIYNVDSPSVERVTVNTAAFGGAMEKALVYVPVIDKFLVRGPEAGGAVYQIDPVTFAVTSLPTSGGGGIGGASNGPHNKFLYVPQLQGCVYVPWHSVGIWYLRVH